MNHLTNTRGGQSMAGSPQSLSGHWLLSRRDALSLSQRLNASRLQQQRANSGTPSPSTVSGYQKTNGAAVIPVIGLLTKYPSWFDGFMGFTPAITIQQCLMDAVNDSSVTSITLLIDSVGGTCNGSYELADAIAATNKQKPVNAVVSDNCASGGYLLASQCSTIAANDKAMIGGIGVFGLLLDESAADKAMGLAWTLISSGGVKGAGNDGVVTQGLIDDEQRIVDGLYSLFVAKAAAGRGMAVPAMQRLADGRVFLAAEAKQLGLIDSIIGVNEPLTEGSAPLGNEMIHRDLAAEGRSQGERFAAKRLTPVADSRPLTWQERDAKLRELSRGTL